MLGAVPAVPVIFLLLLTFVAPAMRQPQAVKPQPAAEQPGRVVVTVSVEGLRIPAVNVALRSVDGNVVIGQTMSDAVGQATFPDVPPGRYVINATRDGFVDSVTSPFVLAAGEAGQVLVEMQLTFVRENVEVIVPANSPTESLQPVAVSDVLTGAKMDIQPLAGDDFQSLLTVLPSTIRGPEGRLRVKGGAPTTGALQMSSASLNDPSTGDFDLELPSGAVESVEVLSNPFAAEFGRFSTSVTQVRTKRGTNEWIIKPTNLVPGLGKGGVAYVDKFEPRLSISSPLKRDRLLIGQHFQYRYVKTAVKSLPGEPQLGLNSFDSFTRLDATLSSRHALTGGVIYFPRKITNATLSTFRPEETTPRFTQSGFSAGAVDRIILTGQAVLESTLASRTFEVDQKTQGTLPMVYAPQGQSGNFFNRQERNVRSLQLVEVLTVAKNDWFGDHVFKVGVDLQHSSFDGDNYSQQVDIVRLDGSLAERTTYSPPLTNPKVSGTEAAFFVQDRWHVNDRLNIEAGLRSDRDDIVEQVNYSPRVGVAISVLPEGRAILRGGVGKFAERTPLNVGAFSQYDVQTIRRYAVTGAPLGEPITYTHVVGLLHTPESLVETVAWDQRFGRRVFFKTAYLHRTGSHAAVLEPDAGRGELRLTSNGESKYWELETTGRFLASEHRDLSVSYVRSHGTRHLNDYDQFFGNFRNPIIRPDELAISSTDVPNRVIVRGTIGLPGRWVLSPLYEWRTGFPWSAVNEFQDFVGPRNESGRLPSVSTLDFSVVRPLRFRKYRFSAGIKVYNAFNTGDERDVQNNLASPDYGKFYNPIQRSIGLTFGSSRP